MIEPHQNIFKQFIVNNNVIDRIALFFHMKIKIQMKKVSSDSVHGSPLDFKLLCVVVFFSSFLSHFSIITMKLHKLC